ncbi:energy transducer TonB [Spongiimicrobium salis]|uniref:energy transducer TonB n=1 Tax=Spongiimicrobium salis TaxID=1667022 RepID=UPI00374CB431
MIQKTKSKTIMMALKYALVLPLIFGMLWSTSVEAQSQGTDTKVVMGYPTDEARQEHDMIPFVVVEEVPIFPGCEKATNKGTCFNSKLKAHIKEHFKYPKKAKNRGIEGKVSSIFTINKKGNIVGVRQRASSPILEEEVLRILKKLPQMEPGRHKGKVVNVAFSVPVTFNLHGKPSSFNIPEPATRTKKKE